MKLNLRSLKNDERGLASIVIAILVILLLTLIVLAMARDAQREQRQALDRQLNSQAYYAAESGINDTIEYARGAEAQVRKTTCEAQDGFPSNPVISEDDQISYSCVLYDKEPKSIISTVKIGDSYIVPIESSESILRLEFEWHSAAGKKFIGCDPGNDHNLPTVTAYEAQVECDAGLLRVELIDAANANDRNALIDNNYVSFLKPSRFSAPDGTKSYGESKGLGGAGDLYRVPCIDDKGCSFTLNNGGGPLPSKLYLRLTSSYEINNVTIKAFNVAGDQLRFKGAQMMVDATGKANDILKRIQVRVPLAAQAAYDYPEFAIQTNSSICKQLSVYPPAFGQGTTECPL